MLPLLLLLLLLLLLPAAVDHHPCASCPPAAAVALEQTLLPGGSALLGVITLSPRQSLTNDLGYLRRYFCTSEGWGACGQACGLGGGRRGWARLPACNRSLLAEGLWQRAFGLS